VISAVFALALTLAPPPTAGACTQLSVTACADAAALAKDPGFRATLREFTGNQITGWLTPNGRAYDETLAMLSGGPPQPPRKLRSLYVFTGCADATCEDQGAVVLLPDGELIAAAALHTDCNSLRRTSDCVSRQVLTIMRRGDDFSIVDALSEWARTSWTDRPVAPGTAIKHLDRVEVGAVDGPAPAMEPLEPKPAPRNQDYDIPGPGKRAPRPPPAPPPAPTPPPPGIPRVVITPPPPNFTYRPEPVRPALPPILVPVPSMEPAPPKPQPLPAPKPVTPEPPPKPAAKAAPPPEPEPEPEPPTPKGPVVAADPNAPSTAVSGVTAVAASPLPRVPIPLKVYQTLNTGIPTITVLPPPPPPPPPKEKKKGPEMWKWRWTPYGY
jgi:hypothetical protein